MEAWRVGAASAVVWAVIGLALAWLAAQIGFPSTSGWLAIASAALALPLVGRYYRVREPGDWFVAALAMVVVGFLMFGVAAMILAMAAYG